MRRFGIVVLLLLLAGCAKDDGVHRADVDAVQAQLDDVSSQVSTMRDQRDEATASLTEADQRVSELEDDLAAALETTTTTLPPTTTTTAPAVPVEVGRFSGTSDTQTADVTVVGAWSLTAQVSGGAGIIVELNGLNDHVSFDPGETTSQFRSGGTFFLDVSTFGSSWTVIVTDLPG